MWHQYDLARFYLTFYEKEGEDFLHQIMALKEIWTRSYKPKRKSQLAEWHHIHSPRLQKFRQAPSNIKVILLAFHDFEDVFLCTSYELQSQFSEESHSSCNLLETTNTSSKTSNVLHNNTWYHNFSNTTASAVGLGSVEHPHIVWISSKISK